jgi:hypothetical protein
MLTKDSILQANDLVMELVRVPMWDGEVYIRVMTAAARDRFDKGNIIKTDDGFEANFDNLRARLVTLTACDDKGNPLFDESDASQLGLKSGEAVDLLAQVARRINKLDKKDVEESIKN